MLLKKYNQYLKTRWQRKIAKQVRAGLLPVGVTKEEIWEALKVTKPRNSTEMFGFLSAVVHRPDGSLKQDYGLVSVREVTTAFALRVVDALCDSAVSMAGFNQHKMGSGSTSQTSSHTALVARAS